MQAFTNINSIYQLHQLLGYEKEKHPLVSVIDFSKIHFHEDFMRSKNVLNLYQYSVKKWDKFLIYSKISGQIMVEIFE